jgi:hypothetical protein
MASRGTQKDKKMLTRMQVKLGANLKGGLIFFEKKYDQRESKVSTRLELQNATPSSKQGENAKDSQ